MNDNYPVLYNLSDVCPTSGRLTTHECKQSVLEGWLALRNYYFPDIDTQVSPETYKPSAHQHRS